MLAIMARDFSSPLKKPWRKVTDVPKNRLQSPVAIGAACYLALSIFFALSSTSSFARAKKVRSVTPAEPIVWDPAISVWAADDQRELVSTPINSGNNAAEVPAETRTLELRPSLKVRDGNLRAVARPRFIVTDNLVKKSVSPDSSKWQSKLLWTEGFATWDIADFWSISYGLQNFQWGAAEAASPSNQIFHDTILAKDLLYDVRGRHLVRMNFTPSPNWSEIILFEPSGNGEPELGYANSFTPVGLLKSEISWAGGSDYFGLVMGQRIHSGNWLGEYFNAELLPGLSVYADASQQKGSDAYYPGPDSTGNYTVLAETRQDDPRIFHYVVSGTRYSFENGSDVRLEWIFQSGGYDEADLLSAWNSVVTNDAQQQAYAPGNLIRLRQNGMEFLGKNYLFFSVRYPDAFRVRDWTFYLRLLHSLQDQSNAAFFNTDLAASDHANLFASIGGSSGRPQNELRGLIALEGMLGFRLSW